jgi:hypothetical protein
MLAHADIYGLDQVMRADPGWSMAQEDQAQLEETVTVEELPEMLFIAHSVDENKDAARKPPLLGTWVVGKAPGVLDEVVVAKSGRRESRSGGTFDAGTNTLHARRRQFCASRVKFGIFKV